MALTPALSLGERELESAGKSLKGNGSRACGIASSAVASSQRHEERPAWPGRSFGSSLVGAVFVASGARRDWKACAKALEGSRLREPGIWSPLLEDDLGDY